MKEVTAYKADNGVLCNTADEALHHDEVDRIRVELNNLFYLRGNDDNEIAAWIAENFKRKEPKSKKLD
jgi:hypothetical protein